MAQSKGKNNKRQQPNANGNTGKSNRKPRNRKSGGPTSEGRRLAYGGVSRALGVSIGENLTRLMATPKEAELVRMPTPDMPLVALLRADAVFSVTNSDSAANGFEAGTVNYMLFGQPGRGLIYGPVPEPNNYSFRFKHGNEYNSEYSFLKSDIYPMTVGAVYETTSSISSCSIFSGSSVHGTNRPLGNKNGYNYIWANVGEVFSVQLFQSSDTTTWTALAYSGQGSFELYDTDSGSEPETRYMSGPFPGTTSYSHTLTRAGYYRPAVRFIPTTGSGATIYIAAIMYLGCNVSGNLAYPIKPLPQLNQVRECGFKCRRTALSLLITNTSAEMYTQGNVIAARLDADYVHRTTRDQLESSADKYTGKAKNGCYTYMDFSQAAEAFVDASDRSHYDPTISTLVYDLGWSDMVHFISVTSPNPSTQSNNYIVTMDAVVEFMTDKPQYSRGVSQQSFLQLVEARRINNMSPYFFENPLHLRDITRRIQEVWQSMRRYATPIGLGLSAAFPEAAPAIMPVARYLQR